MLLAHTAVAFAAAAHAAPHPPQFAGSYAVFTQLVPQSEVPPTQLSTHMLVASSQMRPPVQVVAAASQRSVASLQVSAPLQVTASRQSRAAPPTHAPVAEHVSPTEQYEPSSQLAPAFGLHAVVDAAVLQIWQGFEGFEAPGAGQTPAITHPLQVVRHASAAVSQT